MAAVKSFPTMATNESTVDYTYVYVGLVFMAFVAVASVSCVLGAIAGSAATWTCVQRRNRVQHLRRPLHDLDLHDGPERKAEIDELAAFLQLGGEAAIKCTATKLGSTAEDVREWYVAWQASRQGPALRQRRN